MNEPNGFREYVAARQASLLRSAWLLTGDWHLAEDLVQSTLVSVWPRWTQVEPGSPDAYIRRSMVRKYLTWRRRMWWAERPSEQSVLEEAWTPNDTVGLRDALLRALLNLPSRQRMVVVLRFYEDLSVQEVADLMNCSIGTVKSQTSKALAKLASVRELEEFRL